MEHRRVSPGHNRSIARWTLDAATIADLAVGSAVLGTGGGGDPHIGALMALDAVAQHGPATVIPASDLADDALVAIVNMSGAPTVLTEKIPNGGEIERVLSRVAEAAGRPVDAIISVEIGGMNSVIPVVAAVRHDLPLVDADGMGRAFPEFQITAFNAGGVRFGPRFVTDEKGNVLRIDAIDAEWIERINRRALVAMGGSVITALGLTGADVKRTAIHGTISLAVAIGEALRRARSGTNGWLDQLRQVVDALPLFAGKVVSVDRRTEGGWTRGHAIVAGLAGDHERSLRIDFQNEHLLARHYVHGELDRILATTPDLIVVLDSETGTPITTEGLHYGQRVTVLGIPSPSIWRTSRGLELAGPRHFGFKLDYVPLEERVAAFARSSRDTGAPR
jgi:uncharacterized protein